MARKDRQISSWYGGAMKKKNAYEIALENLQLLKR